MPKKILFTGWFGRTLTSVEKYTILLVDDHRILLEGIKNLINSIPEFEVKDVAATGSQALELIRKNDYHLLITDYEMPGLTGLELIKAARAAQPDIKVIVLSMHDDASVVRELLRSGIHGYVLKKDTHTSLVEALHKVMDNKKFLSEEISDLLIQLSDGAEDRGVLTAREEEILRLVAKEYTSRQIAEILFISERTVETHRKNILRKTGSPNLVALIKYAYANNLI
ncbi:MAG: response regulator transcription factor [Bacteroidetes bacterium]|nr:response regulator transcription factor [Bacteroidota bacterium]